KAQEKMIKMNVQQQQNQQNQQIYSTTTNNNVNGVQRVNNIDTLNQNKSKGVSFLEYVEVSTNNNNDQHLTTNMNDCNNTDIVNVGDGRPLSINSIPRTIDTISTPPATTASSSSIYLRTNGLFHYEPLHPPATTTAIGQPPPPPPSSSSPFESTTTSTENSCNSPLSPPLVSLIDGQQHQPNIIYKPVRSLIQYWPENHQPHHPHHHHQQQQSSSLILSPANSPLHPLQLNQQQQQQQSFLQSIDPTTTTTTMFMENLISKSSSSDSDTNDSVQRLISDSSLNDFISASFVAANASATNSMTNATSSSSSASAASTTNHVYLSSQSMMNGNNRLIQSNTIDTIVEQESETVLSSSAATAMATMNKNNGEELWIQIQAISKSSSTTTTKTDSKNRKNRKNFQFRRIGYGNFQSFNNMIQILHSNQIRVILDLNPTITSDEHPWQPKNPDYVDDYGDYIDDDNNLNGDFVHQPGHHSVINHPDDHFVDDDEEPQGGRWLNWSNEAIPKQILKIADFWLRYVDGIYLKNLDKIHINDDDSGGDNPSGDNTVLIKREKILLEFLQRLRRISDGYQQQQQQQKSTKKILICSSHLLSPLLTANRRVAAAAAAAAAKKRRRQTSFQQNYPPLPRPRPNHQNEFRPEFDELDMNDFFDNPITDDDQNDDNKNIDSDSDSEQQSISSGYRKIHASANSQKMLPSSDSTSTSSLSTSIVNHGHHNQSLSIRSIYHYFDLVHFELIIRPNHIDTIRDQVNFVFLNRPADFPTIMWSLGGNSGHRHQRRRRPLYRQLRLANRIGSSNYSLACLFMLTMMPGTIMIFYGDEIGLTNLYNQNQQNHHHYHYRHNVSNQFFSRNIYRKITR
ncbi:hypothetical protein DERP_003634, partial [Dermatophagoides pteronyssinus]